VCSSDLVNRRPEIAQGEASDLQHALSFADKPMVVRAAEVDDTVDSDIVVLCVSVPASGDVKSRLDLAVGNGRLFNHLVPPLAKASPHAIFIVVSNPVDVLTWHTLKLSNFDPGRVIGTGTLIDSARLRAMLSQKVGIHPDDVRAYILGEHGQSQFPAYSLEMAGGVRIEQSIESLEMFEQAVNAGEQVYKSKGYTNYAIAMATTLIIDAIVHNANRTMPASVLIDNYVGVKDVCLSVPVVIGRPGVTQVLRPPLNEIETTAFRKSAVIVRKVIDDTLRDADS